MPEIPDTSSAPVSTAEVALFPLNTVLFPGGPLPLRIFEPRYVDMVRRCLRERSAFGVVLILGGSEVGDVTSTAEIGTTARIADFYALPDGLLGIACLGERKFRVVRCRRQSDGLNIAEVVWLPPEEAVPLPPQYAHLGELMRKVLPELGELYERVEKHVHDAAWVGCRLAEILPVSLSEKQQCLELQDPITRLARLSPLIRPIEE
jgi:Lon protease-like protein